MMTYFFFQVINEDIKKFQTAPTKAPITPEKYHVPVKPSIRPKYNELATPTLATAPMPQVK